MTEAQAKNLFVSADKLSYPMLKYFDISNNDIDARHSDELGVLINNFLIKSSMLRQLQIANNRLYSANVIKFAGNLIGHETIVYFGRNERPFRSEANDDFGYYRTPNTGSVGQLNQIRTILSSKKV